MRQYGNLHFLKVYDAGHMVPMDQPKNALAMLTRFIADDWTLDTVKDDDCEWEFSDLGCRMLELCGTGCDAGCNWSWPKGSTLEMDDPQTTCRCMDCIDHTKAFF